MQIQLSVTLFRRLSAVLAVAAAITGIATMTGLALMEYNVSQKGREFRPTALSINRNEAVTIVNDDADLLHHAYIASDKLNYDSGDQGPGSKISITFPTPGTFEVLCAIHPKMKLVVQVK